MMKATFCYHLFMILIISSKNVYAAKRILQEAEIRNEKLEIMDVQDLVDCGFKVDIERFDVLYVRDPYLNGSAEFLPQIVALAKRFKAAGKKVVDEAIAGGELGRGKWADYQKLKKAGLLIPKTSLLSVIARSASDEAISSRKRLPRPSPIRLRLGRLELAEMAAALGARNDSASYPLSTTRYPLILKWNYGFKSKHTFLARDEAVLNGVVQKYPADELLIQEFIPAEFEYKIITVGYKALPVALRFKVKDGGFRVDFREYRVIQTPTTPSRLAGHPSLAGGEAPRKIPEHPRSISSFFKEEYPAKRGEVVGVEKIQKIIRLAEQSSALLSRELAKVDILESAGKFYVLEVNRFPGLKSFEELTKSNVTADFLRYLQKPPV
jgi:glutathione synthase/RimK-type ligase-like ATP-grasp enzyme